MFFHFFKIIPSAARKSFTTQLQSRIILMRDFLHVVTLCSCYIIQEYNVLVWNRARYHLGTPAIFSFGKFLPKLKICNCNNVFNGSNSFGVAWDCEYKPLIHWNHYKQLHISSFGKNMPNDQNSSFNFLRMCNHFSLQLI